MHVILETPRLILRQFTENDVDNLFELNSDPEVMRYLTAGKQTPREVIRDEIIPFHLGVYKRLDRLGTWAAESAATGVGGVGGAQLAEQVVAGGGDRRGGDAR